MRLLHTTELRFQEFFDSEIPPYAILSHRWGSDEVSHQDFLAGHKKNGAGFAKILASCEYAAREKTQTMREYREPTSQSYNWIWIDTCCIDKSSSAELSEAINSMYRWYKGARVCFAYLDDVSGSGDGVEAMEQFENSSWFTRGWTLQKLLAPEHVLFLNKHWSIIETRNALSKRISRFTAIPWKHLTGLFKPSGVPVAQKLRWSAKRKTSRREDRAYCLLGLLDISLPLLYGEGDRAFRRLQLEVIRSSDDESVFVWGQDTDFPARRVRWPVFVWQNASKNLWDFTRKDLLAKSLDNFNLNLCEQIEYQREEFAPLDGLPRFPYAVTNKGLELRIPKQPDTQSHILLPLNCLSPWSGRVYAILLVRNDALDNWYRLIGTLLPEEQSVLKARYGAAAVGSGLFLVSERDVWTRKRLTKTESELVYVVL